MNKLAVTVLFVVGVCLVFAQTASGTEAPLGVYFDTAGTQRTASVIPGVPFNFYVVAHDVPHSIGGYEIGVAVPPEIIVLSRSVPVGTNYGTGDNFIVGTGVPVPGAGPVVLVEYLAITLAPHQDLVIGLLPTTPTSFTPPSPGYADFNNPSDLYPFTCWETGGGGEGIISPVTLTPSTCQTPSDTPPLGVYFDTAGMQRTMTVTPTVPFNFYVVTHDVAHDIGGYEIGVAVPPEITVLSRSVPVGTNYGTGDNFLVGTGVPVPGTGPVVLVEYQAIVFAADQDLVIGLLPTSPTSFTPPSPGYADFDNPSDLYPFTCWETGGGGEGIVNPVTLTPSECPGINNPPVAICENVTVTADADCDVDASIDGGSYDPDGDAITVEQTPPGPYPLGTTTVTLTVTDAGGLSDQCTADVTVVDVTPPEITVELNRDCLWPPNHKMADIIATVTVTDNCCSNPAFVLTSVTSSEPDDGLADGNTVDDIQGAVLGTADTQFQLRSERSGQGNGRVYTIVYTAEDCSGNTMTTTVQVRVPHDQSGWACGSMGFVPSGVALDPALKEFALIIRSGPGFDATNLDIKKTYVGNVKGVAVPTRSTEIDNDADGRMDLAVFYSARALNILKDEGAIGLHYRYKKTDYLVPDIFALGEPVPLIPVIEIPRGRAGTGEGDDGAGAPSVTALRSAYPNPFNPSTTIPFNLVSQERVSLQIYDAQGKLVRTLRNDVVPAGQHEAVWDGRDNSGNQMATGVYFVRFIAGSYEMTRKVVMLK